ncbi:MAG: TatD family hydrolase [Lachnospiraceae bacterium]|nr:TatD family hydrolase [Lachnospiraceae bacterium]
MIFDTHAHYDDARFDEDREALLKSMREHGIGHIINVGAEMKGCRNTVSLVKKYPFLYGAVGVHPDGAPEFDEACIEELRQMAGEERIIAIGEIGLDYAYMDELSPEEAERTKEIQKKCFAMQLALARELRYPVFIHSRDAAADTMEMMREHTEAAKAEGSFRGGIIHCYAYSPEMAEEYVKMGYVLGIGGVVTFKNAKKLPEVVERIPLTSLVLETDSPYLAPVPHRGERNDSTMLSLVAAKVAELKGITAEEVIAVTEANANRLLGLE